MSNRRSFDAVVLRLKPDTAKRLRMAAARQDKELEAVLEDLTEQTYQRDGKAAKAQPSADSPSIKDPRTKAEITRLIGVAKEMR